MPISTLTEFEQQALDILGPGKVFGYRDVCRAWQTGVPETEPVIQYGEDVLLECAEANASGRANWRLIYINGFSLRTQQEKMGWDREQQPCFDPDNTWTWWLDAREDKWATQSVKSGYRLLDFTCRFTDLTWDAQNKEIAKHDSAYERAEELAVAEAVLSTYILNGGERLLTNWYHWGHLQAANGYRVLVGRFRQRGFQVCYYRDGGLFGFFGAVVARKS